MNQGYNGLFSVLLLLVVILVAAGIMGSQLWEAWGEIQRLNDIIVQHEGAIRQQDAKIQNLLVQVKDAVDARQAAETQAGQLDSQVRDLAQRLDSALSERDRLTQSAADVQAERDRLIQQVTGLQTERDRLAEQVRDLTARLAATEEQLRNAQALPAPVPAVDEYSQPAGGLLDLVQRDPLEAAAAIIIVFLSGASLSFVVVMLFGQRLRRGAPVEQRAVEPAGQPTGAYRASPNGHDPQPGKGNQQADPKAEWYAPGKTDSGPTLTPVKLTPKGDNGRARGERGKDNR